jgi:hypothetical protein
VSVSDVREQSGTRGPLSSHRWKQSTLQVGDSSYTIDRYYTAQSHWYEIDVAFQMDGNWEREPYKVWLDNLTLSAY